MPTWSGASIGTALRAVVCVLLAALAACATASDPTQRTAAGASEIAVEVRNQTQNAVTIYAWSGSFRDRLGMVEADQSETFTFKWTLGGPAQFLMDFLAQGCVISDPIDVNDGDELILTVMPFDRRRASRAFCRG